MANAIFGYGNAVDLPGTAIACGSQLSNLPADNLADPDLQLPWVTNGTTTDYVTAIFPSEQLIRIVGLAGALLTGTATVRFRLYSDADMTTVVHDGGVVPANVAEGYWTSLEVLAAAVTARAVRIDIVDAARATETVNGQAPGDLIIGRLWASRAIQPLRNISYPLSEEWCDMATKQRGRRSGSVSVDPGPKYRQISFGYEALPEAEGRGTFKEFLRNTGIGSQIVFIPDPGGAYQSTEAIIGRRVETSPVTRANFALWSHSAIIAEDPALGA